MPLHLQVSPAQQVAAASCQKSFTLSITKTSLDLLLIGHLKRGSPFARWSESDYLAAWICL